MPSTPPLPSPMCSAALVYARRGWPVFPCHEHDGKPYTNKKGETTIARAKAPRIVGAVSKNGQGTASTDEAVIRGWWRKWPNALIGLPMGINGLFALDFDPRVDDATGEVFTLETLKAALEEQMGCALPISLAAITPSGGVHVFLQQPRDGGDPIRNRGNLPRHVDVRGLGGYVVASPSMIVEPAELCSTGRYRWHRGDQHTEAAEAPAVLIEILRSPKHAAPKAPPSAPSAGGQQADVAGGTPAASPSSSPAPASSAPPGPSPWKSGNPSGDSDEEDHIAQVVRRYAYGALDGEVMIARGAPDGQRNNIVSACALTLGHLVGAGALTREAVIAALGDVARMWPDVAKTMASIESGVDKGAAEPRDLSRVIEDAREKFRRRQRYGQRAAAPPDQGSPWGSSPRTPIDDGTSEPFRTESSADDDAGRGSGEDDDARNRRLGWFPLTDLGNAERFRERFGRDFRWSNALGWLGWDGQRWVVLDQDEKSTPAVVLGAVFEMVRAIQDEADAIAASGVKAVELEGSGDPSPIEVAQMQLHAETGAHEDALDYIVDVKRGRIVLFSDMVAKWGRTSEAAGKLGCIANLVRPWLAVKADAFDADALAINVQNGTLRFRRVWDAERKVWLAQSRFDPHAREDLITKLAPVLYDPRADCPIYDDMFAWAQPAADMQRYLHQWAGLSMTGDMGEQKLHFWYGLGGNAKSTVIDAWCVALGDYTTSVGIETFLDQGVKKRGDQATPDLAKLGGVRLLRTSEPEKGAKLATALIKLVTGGEPMSVRYLNRGFFDLRPIFKMTISGNFRPDIPDTDDGIWRRVKLIPWLQRVKDETNPNGTREKDPDLPKKLLPEMSGIFNRLVGGLLDWLANGLVEPEAVTAATKAYRDDSDPLGRFLRLCTKPEAGSQVQSSKLHAVFAAWCKAAGEKEWSNKGFSKAMADKGFVKKHSDGMHWLGLELTRAVHDFVDEQGNARPFSLPEDAIDDERAAAPATPPALPPHPPSWDEEDDDLPP